jgi:transcriptional regulator with XRE-family HTH domain
LNLKSKRLERKMTQEEVAAKCGITQCSYSYYEIGKRSPKPEMLKKLASVLKCTVDELLEEERKEEL